jgi:hypothetical protein
VPGVSGHALNDFVFVISALVNIGVRSDNLLDRTEDVTDEESFAALRVLQEYGVQGFDHIIHAVSPPLV